MVSVHLPYSLKETRSNNEIDGNLKGKGYMRE
jgi:hypothetical protein